MIALKYADTAGDPISLRMLQTQLFDGPWPTGTMRQAYEEMSRGKFSVGGQVTGWVPLPGPEAYYVGPGNCHGTCQQGRLGEMLVAALRQIDDAIDFSAYDDNGTDDVANSGDDDGYVDFIAFVHPTSGAECRRDPHVWSHRYSLRHLTGSDFITNDRSRLGAQIRIDDYVIMPAKACDGTSMIQIGVFAHEFGHAFGLPDLYDTKPTPTNHGLGGWDLMASGSWGGNGEHPELPSHMSALTKEYLGWVTPQVVTADGRVTLRPVLTTGDVVRVDYGPAADPEDNRYLLVEYRKRTGFDRSLPGDGLLITEIDNAAVAAGLRRNSVNNDAAKLGIDVIEADGLMELDNRIGHADAGDLHREGSAKELADAGGAEPVRAALCNVTFSGDAFSFDVMTSQTTCPGNLLDAVRPTDDARTLPFGQQVVIKGTLDNEGSNYFTDRKLVLVGPDGSTVDVNVPVALEVPVGPVGRPPVLSDLLGSDVVVRGSFGKELDNLGQLRSVFTVDEIGVIQ